MAFSNSPIKRFLFLLAVIASLDNAIADSKVWPSNKKAAAITGCRLSIINNAERDYQKRHNSKELPMNIREKIAGAIEPFLAVCDCIFDELEKQWSYEFFVANQDKLSGKLEELGSQCVPKTAQQDIPADGLVQRLNIGLRHHMLTE